MHTKFKISPEYVDGVPWTIVSTVEGSHVRIELSDATSGMGSIILNEESFLKHRKTCQFVEEIDWKEFFDMFLTALRTAEIILETVEDENNETIMSKSVKKVKDEQGSPKLHQTKNKKKKCNTATLQLTYSLSKINVHGHLQLKWITPDTPGYLEALGKFYSSAVPGDYIFK